MMRITSAELRVPPRSMSAMARSSRMRGCITATDALSSLSCSCVSHSSSLFESVDPSDPSSSPNSSSSHRKLNPLLSRFFTRCRRAAASVRPFFTLRAFRRLVRPKSAAYMAATRLMSFTNLVISVRSMVCVPSVSMQSNTTSNVSLASRSLICSGMPRDSHRSFFTLRPSTSLPTTLLDPPTLLELPSLSRPCLWCRTLLSADFSSMRVKVPLWLPSTASKSWRSCGPGSSKAALWAFTSLRASFTNFFRSSNSAWNWRALSFCSASSISLSCSGSAPCICSATISLRTASLLSPTFRIT
mmetsp:Transcript_67740/g.126854  ORF Transcript_67740/g.126854 Transcript_67740/m.126854 type:complete len:301 (+) Transcript_67740:158-1060(+)